MTRLALISLGVHDCARAGAFWAAALGYVRRPPRYAGDDWIVLEPPAGQAGAALAMDRSDSPVQEFPRIHFDLDAGDRPLAEEVERLVSLGAQRVDWPFYPDELEPGAPPYVVLADPEGNRFCVAGRH